MSQRQPSIASPPLPLLLVHLVALMLLASASVAFAAPKTLQVHGVLRAAGGGPVADGGYPMTFLLYADDQAINPLWSEAAMSIKVSGGHFAHVLGTSKPLDSKVLVGAKAPELALKVGNEQELPRRPLHAVAFAMHAATTGGLDCSGCIGADHLGKGAVGNAHLAAGAVGASQVGFTYAGSKTKGGPANSALDLKCTGCVSVGELKIDGDLDLGGNALLAKLVKAAGINAGSVSASTFVGDGSKLTGIVTPAGACKNKDEVMVGIASDGSLKCAVVASGAQPGTLHTVSSGLLTTQFVEVAKGPTKALPIPDNNPIGLSDELTFPDVGVAKSLKVNVHATSSDIGQLMIELFDPANGKHVLYNKAGKGGTLKGTWPTPDKQISGDLGSWAGKNPKGKWRIKLIDTKLGKGGNDGELLAWSVEVLSLSNKQVAATGDLLLKGDLTFTDKGQAKLLRVHNAATTPAKCDASTTGLLWYSTKDKALYICAESAFQKVAAFGNDGSSPGQSAKSCLDIKTKGKSKGDGLYWIKPGAAPVEVWCDMSTAGGGWTLAATVHEDNIGAKCNGGDKWTSTKGNSASHPAGDGNWQNTATFGSVKQAASADYKSSAYFELVAKDVMLYHVPNGTGPGAYRSAAFLRYHTKNGFMSKYGGNLRNMYNDHYPLKFGSPCNNSSKGPAVPVVWDLGSNSAIDSLIAPNAVGESTPGYIHFRVFNNEKGCFALCSGIRYDGCNSEHACIGGGGWFPEGNPKQCGDFSGWDWDGYGASKGWSASKKLTEAAVFIFYR